MKRLPFTTTRPDEVEARFFAKVALGKDECWEWTAARAGGNARGGPPKYGYFGVEAGNYWYAHRWSWTFFRGAIPEGLSVDHLCCNTLCVNPDHMDLVPLRENTLRRDRRRS